MHDSENEHLDVNQELRQSVLEITERNLVGSLDCTARDEQANQNLDVCQWKAGARQGRISYGLPE